MARQGSALEGNRCCDSTETMSLGRHRSPSALLVSLWLLSLCLVSLWPVLLWLLPSWPVSLDEIWGNGYRVAMGAQNTYGDLYGSPTGPRGSHEAPWQLCGCTLNEEVCARVRAGMFVPAVLCPGDGHKALLAQGSAPRAHGRALIGPRGSPSAYSAQGRALEP